ncbi:ATP-binding protein [Legionella londiniensis]|uniref:Histidine kinase-, DNA gyrase B-, and HSP90-like ATPase n=1 Tax=Legionella londiniensis TaxID=45068 RepID=A0A0W0VII1_9GAMM|nr:ATP-binding protein [Legionella londiniensis]KTD19903.1 Histidine kinase-, DNA gyrase B-, and HSP90-like ATPase [Legionella londiniensis]STX94225.1 Histidine kinase-, DNA gyrase B-, and HSP90-like ATPase [Legionella londiniensis]
MYEIRQHESLRLAVKLTMDISHYCKACKRLDEARKRQEPENNKKNCEENASVLKIQYRQLMKKFREEREALGCFLHGLKADLLWLDIKKKLKEQCNDEDLQEKLLKSALADYGKEDIPICHAIESLDYSFVELLKNSVDACIEKFLKSGNQEERAQLEMTIACSLHDNQLSITITDNGCGFPSKYLEHFSSYIQHEEYKDHTSSSKKIQKHEYFYGGENLGIATFLSYFLHGELLQGFKGPMKLREVEQNAVKIAFQNNCITNGAEIIMTSPLASFKPCQHNLYKSAFKGSGSIPECPLLTLPAHKFKNLKNIEPEKKGLVRSQSIFMKKTSKAEDFPAGGLSNSI